MQKYKKTLLKASDNKKNVSSLDTLVHLRTNNNNPAAIEKKMSERAKSKYITNSFILGLVDLDSDMKQSYWNTFHCNRNVFIENGKITTKYCKNRWCLVCARIKTATIINHYLPVINQFIDKQFVTLTVPNVRNEDLRTTIELMQKQFTKIKDGRKLRGKVKGMRKLEVTYNPKRNTYHPHYHLIVDGEEIGNIILKEWLRLFPNAKRIAQDIKKADDKSVLELLKYATKIISHDTINKTRIVYLRALDNILFALKRKRTFQCYGIKKLQLDDDFSISLENRKNTVGFFEWEQEIANWISVDNYETLIDYTLSATTIELSSQIKESLIRPVTLLSET